MNFYIELILRVCIFMVFLEEAPTPHAIQSYLTELFLAKGS